MRKTPINSKKIKERIKELGLTQGDIAKALGLAQSTVNQKINNVRSMSVDEAEKLAELLKIGDQDFCIYFFGRRLREGGGEHEVTGIFRDDDDRRRHFAEQTVGRKLFAGRHAYVNQSHGRAREIVGSRTRKRKNRHFRNIHRRKAAGERPLG